MKLRNKTLSEQGFTILELLIATTVFSFILLVVTTGIIRIGNMYYKGLTSSRTQETVRNVTTELAASIQFAGGEKRSVDGSPNVFCLGNFRYTYFLNGRYTIGNETNSGLYVEELAEGASCDCTINCVETAKQILGNNMRLLALSVDPVGTSKSVWNISVKVAYGDDDLLSNSGVNNNDPTYLSQVTCKGGAGSSFCATAELDTSVKKRLQ